jgi:serine protease Do
MNELIAKGRVSRGALGVVLQNDFRPEDATALGMDRPRGAWISRVNPSSPASRAGLRDGDVVLRFAGVAIVDLNHLINTVSMAPIGQPAEVVVWRDRRELTLRVTVGERDRMVTQLTGGALEAEKDSSGLVRRPARPGVTSSFAMGLELSTLNPQLARRMDLPETWRGALVLGVEALSPLAELVHPSDVLSSIDNEAIQSAEQAVKILNQRAGKASTIISLDRLTKGVIERHTIRLP